MKILSHFRESMFRIAIAAGLAGLLSVPAAQAERPFSLPSNAKQIAKDIYDLGTGMHNGEQVRGIAFIDSNGNSVSSLPIDTASHVLSAIQGE